MRWSVETGWSPRGNRALMLRNDKGGPIAMVMEDLEIGDGYFALILEPGFPRRSGFRHPIGAVLWVEVWVVRHLMPNAKFGPVPELRTARREAHAAQVDDRRRMDRHPR